MKLRAHIDGTADGRPSRLAEWDLPDLPEEGSYLVLSEHEAYYVRQVQRLTTVDEDAPKADVWVQPPPFPSATDRDNG